MQTTKPIASLSLDLDNQWAYMRTHSDSGWETFPSYFDNAVPRILNFLKNYDLTITFFVVGQDAALKRNHAALHSIASAGHEIGNHSFSHTPWLHLYTEQQILKEITRAEEEIEQVTGYKTIGFRGPGYSLSKTVLKVLNDLDYLYDASTLPTFLGPLARAYYFMKAQLTSAEKYERGKLFGTLEDGLRPIRPYQWDLSFNGDKNKLVEIPVTTMPLVKIPFHLSYILYISTFSYPLAISYFRTALFLCRLTGVQPSLLLHPIDFLGWDDVEGLDFFPGMSLHSEEKMRVLDSTLRLFAKQFDVLTMQGHTDRVVNKSLNRIIEPKFGTSDIS